MQELVCAVLRLSARHILMTSASKSFGLYCPASRLGNASRYLCGKRMTVVGTARPGLPLLTAQPRRIDKLQLFLASLQHELPRLLEWISGICTSRFERFNTSRGQHYDPQHRLNTDFDHHPQWIYSTCSYCSPASLSSATPLRWKTPIPRYRSIEFYLLYISNDSVKIV